MSPITFHFPSSGAIYAYLEQHPDIAQGGYSKTMITAVANAFADQDKTREEIVQGSAQAIISTEKSCECWMQSVAIVDFLEALIACAKNAAKNPTE